MKLEFLNYAGPSPVTTALGSEEWGEELLASIYGTYGTEIGMGGLVGQLA